MRPPGIPHGNHDSPGITASAERPQPCPPSPPLLRQPPRPAPGQPASSTQTPSCPLASTSRKAPALNSHPLKGPTSRTQSNAKGPPSPSPGSTAPPLGRQLSALSQLHSLVSKEARRSPIQDALPMRSLLANSMLPTQQPPEAPQQRLSSCHRTEPRERGTCSRPHGLCLKHR